MKMNVNLTYFNDIFNYSIDTFYLNILSRLIIKLKYKKI